MMMNGILFLIFGSLLAATIGKAELINGGSVYVRWGHRFCHDHSTDTMLQWFL